MTCWGGEVLLGGALGRRLGALRFLPARMAFSKWLKKCELERLQRWTCTRTCSHSTTHRDVAAAEEKTYVVSPTHGHGSCRSKVLSAFASHTDFSARTYLLEPCSCASFVCLPPSPTLARLSTPFFIFLPWTLNLQDKPSTPRHRNSVACGGSPRGTSVAAQCPHCLADANVSVRRGCWCQLFLGLDRV